ncbi:sensor histidine kinase [Deinococcus pimensis]|uniref:sensor histidine kinase n=1 Tax=Deinococcus pimensis TaxID=309888 RepID=UPI0004ACC07E|nr:ATP-binding protein [Deinococcus pimensis]
MPTDEQRALELRVRTLESDLQACRQRAVTLFNEAPAPYFLLDPQGRIVEVNVIGCGLLGRTPEELLRRTWTSYLTPTSRSSFALLLRLAFEDGLVHQGNVQLMGVDGAPSDVLVQLRTQQRNGVGHLLVIATDISEHQRAQQSLLDDNADQEQRLRRQASVTRHLTQELENITVTFIQQLHLPVARALNFLRLHHNRTTPAEQPGAVAGHLGNVEGAVLQILMLLASVERFMDLRRMRLTVRPVDLNKVLSEVLKNATPIMSDRDVRVTSTPLPTVQGDSRALSLILDELIANALKFTKLQEQARVSVMAYETASEYHLGVEDNGVGFNMRHKDRLFQLFGRLHPSTEYEGTGVGLVTVRRMCERFGARAWAEGTPGEGATFWVAWPKAVTLTA